jgi:hypothetical protein
MRRQRLVGQAQDLEHLRLVESVATLEHLLRAA